MAISSSNYRKFVGAAIVCMGIAATTPKPAMGAAAADSNSSSESPLSEIIVTATRRAERLQDVPMSITALSGVELTKRGATDVNDIKASRILTFGTEMGDGGRQQAQRPQGQRL